MCHNAKRVILMKHEAIEADFQSVILAFFREGAGIVAMGSSIRVVFILDSYCITQSVSIHFNHAFDSFESLAK